MKKIVVTRIDCGLGNQMFQYAMGFALAKRKHAVLWCDITYVKPYGSRYKGRKYGLEAFKITGKTITIHRLWGGYGWGKVLECLHSIFILFLSIFGAKMRYCEERRMNVKNDVFDQTGRLFYLHGFWQNENYFTDVQNELRKEFCFVKQLDFKSQELLQNLQGCETVSIHIRLGDYVKQPTKSIFYVCSFLYYAHAIEYMQKKLKNPVFLIFSEDIKLITKSLKFSSPHYFVNWIENDAAMELHLMSCCKHHIISNSTYSWWGAWLNQNPNKIVVSPDHWYIKNPQLNPSIISEKNLSKIMNDLSRVNLLLNFQRM